MYKGLFLLWFCCFSSTILAQNGSIYERKINVSTFRSTGNTYTDMLMDSSGFIWLGGKDGLIRYDGIKLDYFAPDSSNKISDDFVVDIMYIKAEKKILIRFKSGEVFTIKNGIPVMYSNKIGKMDFKLNVHGAFPNTALFDKFNIPIDSLIVKHNWSRAGLSLMTVNSTDFIVASNQPNILYYYKKGNKFKEINIETEFHKFVSYGQHTFFVNTKNMLFLFDSSNYSFTNATMDLQGVVNKIGSVKLENFSVFCDEFSGNTFYVYKNQFFLLETDSSGRKAKLTYLFEANETRLLGNILYDNVSANFFLRTQNNYFFQIKRKAIQTNDVYKLIPDSLDALKAVNYCVLKINDSTAVIPSGFKIINGIKGLSFEKMGNVFGNRETIAVDASGNIVCARSERLFYYTSKEKYLVKHEYNKEFNNTNKYHIPLIYPEGDSLWVFSRRAVYVLTKKTFRKLYDLKSNSIGTHSDPCLFYRLSNDEAFISNKSGLFKIRTKYPYHLDTVPEFKDVSVRYILPYKNVLILSTYGKGIWVQSDSRFYQVQLRWGLPQLTQTHSTFIDKNGYAWIPTDNGLYKTNADMMIWFALHPPADGYPFFLKFSEYDGIDNAEFNGGGTPSYALLKNTLIYPSMGGLVSFVPEQTDVGLTKSNIFLNSIFIDDNKSLINKTDSIYFAADQKLLTIDFSVVNYSLSNNVQLDYKMDNESNWTAVKLPEESKIRSILISPGENKLNIRRRIGFGNDDFLYTSVTIYRDYYFYQKPWFYFIVISFVVFLMWLAASLRTRSLEKKRLVLQYLVDQQTSELAHAVELKDLLISIISHDMIAPLRHVGLVAGVLEKGLEKDPKKIHDALKDIRTTSNRILTDSLSITNWIKLNNNRIPVEKKEVQLYNIVEDIIHTYKPMGAAKGIILKNNVSMSENVEADTTIISTILNNLISNSIKYSNSGEVSVCSYKDNNGDIILKVKDQGIGMSNDTLNMITQLLQNNIGFAKSSSESGTRLGYLLIAELARMHKSKVTVSSKLKEGTEVTIVI